jgi:hypothetical protein
MPEPVVAAPADGDSVLSTWWFWTIVGVVVTASAVTGIAVASSKTDPYLVKGALGTTSVKDWSQP